MTSDRVLAGLDPEQRKAVTAPAGPVCILAGAGTGKTRAITHRIAYRSLAGEISPRHVLAVTFTARAAAEMRARLSALGASGVQARTFHAAALRQVRYFAPRLLDGRAMPELLESKGRLVGLAAARAGVRADRTAARDLASEIEWAKSSLVEPGEYVVAAAKALRDPPYDAVKVGEVFAAYEEIKRRQGVIDFEDMLRAAVWGIEEHPDVAEQIRAQYRHFVVDEYQDVNPLQQRLLEAWLGGRDDLTVVGDASQTIYSFTGATSSYLIDFPRQRRSAVVVRLVRDYRSTPQVVGLANAVIRQARGNEAKLRLELVGQRPPGAEPELKIFPDESAEASAVARRCARAGRRGHAGERDRGAVPDQRAVRDVRGGAGRGVGAVRGARGRAVLRADRGAAGDDRACAPRCAPSRAKRRWSRPWSRRCRQPAGPATGHRPGAPQREQWEALAALVRLAEEYAADPALLPIGQAGAVQRDLTLAGFCAELSRRAEVQHAPTIAGVTLASLHSAKGLEWDAVFLVGLADGTLADVVREDAGAVGGGTPAAVRRGDPGPAVAVVVVRADAQHRPPAAAEPVPAAARPVARRERWGRDGTRRPESETRQPAQPGGVLPDLRGDSAGRRRSETGPLPDLPVRSRRGPVRASADLAGAGRGGAESPCVRGIHRRDRGGAGRAQADHAAATASRSPASGPASSVSTAPRCSLSWPVATLLILLRKTSETSPLIRLPRLLTRA